MNKRKLLKKRQHRKDFLKKKNIIKQEMPKVLDGKIKGFSVEFPKRRKLTKLKR